MLPVETILAVFPSTARVGNLTLRPLTLYHATAFELLGVDIGDPDGIDRNRVYTAAWLMTKTPDEICGLMGSDDRTAGMSGWMQTAECDEEDLLKCVNRMVTACLSVNVPGHDSGEIRTGPRGYGWTLELGEAVAHEYGMTFREAMSMPLQTVFGLIACCRQRNSGKAGGPDYYERIIVNEIRRMKERMRNG